MVSLCVQWMDSGVFLWQLIALFKNANVEPMEDSLLSYGFLLDLARDQSVSVTSCF